jgi:hypothetical protein
VLFCKTLYLTARFRTGRNARNRPPGAPEVFDGNLGSTAVADETSRTTGIVPLTVADALDAAHEAEVIHRDGAGIAASSTLKGNACGSPLEHSLSENTVDASAGACGRGPMYNFGTIATRIKSSPVQPAIE